MNGLIGLFIGKRNRRKTCPGYFEPQIDADFTQDERMMEETDTMPANAVIQRKLEVFDTTLNNLRGYLPVSYETLCNDWGLQKIVERSLQILVEIMIDIAQRIIAERGDVAPQVSADAIRKLKDYCSVKFDLTDNVRLISKKSACLSIKM